MEQVLEVLEAAAASMISTGSATRTIAAGARQFGHVSRLGSHSSKHS
jgi:hypothetical protein